MRAPTLVCRRKNLLKARRRGEDGDARHRPEKLRRARRIGRAQARGEWRRTNLKRTTSELKSGVTRVLRRFLRCPMAEFSPGRRRWLTSPAIAVATTLLKQWPLFRFRSHLPAVSG